jgi:hypothetical protein
MYGSQGWDIRLLEIYIRLRPVLRQAQASRFWIILLTFEVAVTAVIVIARVGGRRFTSAL